MVTVLSPLEYTGSSAMLIDGVSIGWTPLVNQYSGRHISYSNWLVEETVPAADGKLAGVLFGLENADEPVKDLFRPGQLSTLLPPGTYRFANAPHDARLAALAFALGAYRFTRWWSLRASTARISVASWKA